MLVLFNYGRGLINKILEFKLLLNAQNHLMKLPKSFFNEKNEAQLVSDIKTDIGKITMLTDKFVLMSLTQIFSITGSVVGLFIIDPFLLLAVLVIIPIKILVVRYFAKRYEKLAGALIKHFSTYGSLFGDTVKNIDILKLWNLRRRRLIKFTHSQRNVIKTQIDMEYNNKISENVDYFLNFILDIAIYVIGFWGMANSSLTIGGLFAFIAYAMNIIGPITFLTKIQHYFADIKPSLKRHIDFLNLAEEGQYKESSVENYKRKNETKRKLPVTIPDRITFSNVSLSYEDNQLRLDKISFELNKGEKLAIVGGNGSGKSSFVKLLTRFYEPTSGEILFDGENISNFSIDEYRKLFAVISQDIRLFNETVRENIDPEQSKTDAEIITFFETLGFDGLLKELPDGLDTVVGSDGSKLSGGQAQKIVAVRAILKGAKILVLDEATSKYDSKSEEVFNEVLSTRFVFDYTIVITHQKAILDKMDRIIQLEGGRII